MKERINLSLDQRIIDWAKLEAVLQKSSVSQIVENLLWNHIVVLEKTRGPQRRSGMFKHYTAAEWEKMKQDAMEKGLKQQEKDKQGK